MNPKSRSLLVAVVIAWAASLASGMTLSDEQTVLRFADIRKLTNVTRGNAANVDGSISTYVSGDGSRYWNFPYNYAPPGGEEGIYLAQSKVPVAGAKQSPAQLPEYFALMGQSRRQAGQWELFSKSQNFPGRWWVVAVYMLSADPVEYLAFVHVECLNTTCTSWHSRESGIGVAYYRENRADPKQSKLRYMGLAVQAYNRPADFNVQGAPYLVGRDGNIYVYFKDADGTNAKGNPVNEHAAVARTELSDLVRRARQPEGITPKWHKFDAGSWTSDGIGGPSAALDGIDGDYILHTGAAYSRYTRKYYMTAYRGSNTRYVKAGALANRTNEVDLFESTDLVSWRKSGTVFGADGYAPIIGANPDGSKLYAAGYQYTTITPSESGAWTNGSVGKSMNVYTVYNRGTGTDKVEIREKTVRFEPGDCVTGENEKPACGVP